MVCVRVAVLSRTWTWCVDAISSYRHQQPYITTTTSSTMNWIGKLQARCEQRNLYHKYVSSEKWTPEPREHGYHLSSPNMDFPLGTKHGLKEYDDTVTSLLASAKSKSSPPPAHDCPWPSISIRKQTVFSPRKQRVSLPNPRLPMAFHKETNCLLSQEVRKQRVPFKHPNLVEYISSIQRLIHGLLCTFRTNLCSPFAQIAICNICGDTSVLVRWSLMVYIVLYYIVFTKSAIILISGFYCTPILSYSPRKLVVRPDSIIISWL